MISHTIESIEINFKQQPHNTETVERIEDEIREILERRTQAHAKIHSTKTGNTITANPKQVQKTEVSE